jgi:Reverse transcriptase (RNA-dependent DNA polymerase)
MLTGPELRVRVALREHIYHLAKIQEEKWPKQSAALWLKHEDANSKYFHRLASVRHTQNFIPYISIRPQNLANQIQTVTDSPSILAEFTSYYQGLLGSTTPGLSKPNLQLLFDNQASVGSDTLRSLVDPISRSEIKRAVFDLPKDKVAGPDGFPIEFFQNYWDIIVGDLHKAITAFYHNQLNLWHLNQAYITLIPKKKTSNMLADYKPINILSAIPKIIAKILTSRLQPFLSGLINKNQTAFIKGRQLMQTFLSTRELLHHLAEQKISSIFIKIDF